MRRDDTHLPRPDTAASVIILNFLLLFEKNIYY